MPPNNSNSSGLRKKNKDTKTPLGGVLFSDFLMHRVFSTPFAVFFEFYLPFNRFFVFMLVIVQMLASATSQFYKTVAEFSLCHVSL